MKTRKIAAVVLCVLSVVAIFCFRLISAPLTGAVTAAELGSALGALSLLPTVLSVALAFLLGDVVVSLLIGLSVGELMLLLLTGEKGAAQLLQIVPSVIDDLVGVASDTENTKVLILSARCEVADKVAGLDAGANDYLTKPFHLDELAARIRSLTLRRFTQSDVVLTCAELSFDTKARTASVRGETLSLTRKETGILEYLLLHQGRPVSQEELLDTGIKPQTVRLSVGTEHIDDLLADLEQALA